MASGFSSGFHVEGDSSRVLILGMYPPWGFSHQKAEGELYHLKTLRLDLFSYTRVGGILYRCKILYPISLPLLRSRCAIHV
jgi:hypothetical protein